MFGCLFDGLDLVWYVSNVLVKMFDGFNLMDN